MGTYDYIFTIQSATGGTVTLTSSPFTVAQYSGGGGHGGETVAETLEVRIMDGAPTANLAELRPVSVLLQQAKEAQHDHNISPVYLTWQETTGGTIWRSEIVDGSANLRDDALLRGYWTGDTTFAPIVIERKNYWEGPEAQVPLTNANGTANTTGLTVYNCNDGSGTAPTKRVNYVEIAGSSVGGDLPAACRLEITNTYAAAQRLYDVWVGHNYTHPADFVWNYEAESANAVTPSTSASTSGGSFVATIAGTAEAALLTWDITTDQLSAAAGGYVHMLARFPGSGPASRNTRFRARIEWSVTTLWESDQVLPTPTRATILRDLFTFRLPPWLQGLQGLDGIKLTLTGQSITSASQSVNVDFISLLPADGFRYLSFEGYGAETNKRIVDDGIMGDLYMDDGAGAGKIGVIHGYGAPIALQPGKDQRLYFLTHSNALDTSEIARTIGIKLYYRPRRSGL